MVILISAILFRHLSAWFVIPCILLGITYAWLFYHQHAKHTLNYLLFTFRALVVAALAILLLAPVIKSIHKRIEKPVIIVAHDVSASIPLSWNKSENIQQFAKALEKTTTTLKDDYEVQQFDFGDHVRLHQNNPAYPDQYTDVAQLAGYLKQHFRKKNIGALILVSDGLVNHGEQNILQNTLHQMPVYSIALGDTIPKKDLQISHVNYNQLVYLNDFHQLEINLSAYQLSGSNAVLNVQTSDGESKQKHLKITSDEWTEKITVELEARKKGWQKITLSVSAPAEEVSLENNKQIIYVEVIDGKQKILIIPHAPHPDISALKQAIESQQNYKAEIAYPDQLPPDLSAYNLLIFHNLPSAKTTNWPQLLQKSNTIPKWFILGNEVMDSKWGTALNEVRLQPSAKNMFAIADDAFNSFSVSSLLKNFLQQYAAPLTSQVSQSGQAPSVLLTTKDTKEEVLGFHVSDETPYAILWGEGLWRWRMQNAQFFNHTDEFDELVTKTVQLLTSKADKRKFRVYSSKNQFADNENVWLHAELYNDVYQPIAGKDIAVDLTNDKQKFSFVFSPKNQFYELNAGQLPPGNYQFTAKTSEGQHAFSAQGRFVVEKTNAETLNTSANHQFLYSLFNFSDGKMFYPKELSRLPLTIRANKKITSLAYEDERFEDMMNQKWFFVLLMLLLSTEWILRKRNGMV